jgi:hypothetical protein
MGTQKFHQILLRDRIKTSTIFEARSTHGKCDNAYKILVCKPDGKRQLGIIRVDGRIILKLI